MQDEQDWENIMAECELQMQVRFRRRLERSSCSGLPGFEL